MSLVACYFCSMNSMTGYGRATATLDTQTLTVQVNSVNRRGRDLSMSLPD